MSRLLAKPGDQVRGRTSMKAARGDGPSIPQWLEERVRLFGESDADLREGINAGLGTARFGLYLHRSALSPAQEREVLGPGERVVDVVGVVRPGERSATRYVVVHSPNPGYHIRTVRPPYE